MAGTTRTTRTGTTRTPIGPPAAPPRLRAVPDVFQRNQLGTLCLMANWRRFFFAVLFGTFLVTACSSGGEDNNGSDQQESPSDEPGAADQSTSSIAAAQDVTTASTDPAAPTTLVTEEQVAEAQSGYDTDDAAVGRPIEVIDSAGAIQRAEAFIPDQFPEDRAVIDRMIEGETGVAYDFLGYDAVLLYEPLPHCGKLPSLQATQEDGNLNLSVLLDKTGDCSDLAFTAGVGIDFNDGFEELPLIATHE